MAWPGPLVGGEILEVEVNVMEGSGKLELTGNLGDVMQESAKTALSCLRSRAAVLGIEEDFTRRRTFTFTSRRVRYPRTVPPPVSL